MITTCVIVTFQPWHYLPSINITASQVFQHVSIYIKRTGIVTFYTLYAFIYSRVHIFLNLVQFYVYVQIWVLLIFQYSTSL